MKWRILLDLPSFPMPKQSKIIMACMALHNFIRQSGMMDDLFDLCDQDEMIRTWTLPLVDRRLYECEVVGRGLGVAARRRGAVVACERRGRQRWRLGQSRLPGEAE
jgi:hypothetical protein